MNSMIVRPGSLPNIAMNSKFRSYAELEHTARPNPYSCC